MPVKQIKYPKRIFKKVFEVGIPTFFGFIASILIANPGWSFLDPSFLFLTLALICWLLILAYRDIAVDRNYTRIWTGLEDEIYNTKIALDILETIPASRSKKLAVILHGHKNISSDNFIREFLKPTEGIDKIVEAVTEYLASRREAGMNQIFRASFATPVGTSGLLITHSHAKRSSPPAKGQIFEPNNPDTKDTTAMLAWEKKIPMAVPNVEASVDAAERSGHPPRFSYLNHSEKANLKSILCIPIISTDGPSGLEYHGLLSIDTNVKNYFEEIDVQQEYIWCKILTPFIERIVFYARLSKATEVALS